jgi:serine/threonine protein kinase
MGEVYRARDTRLERTVAVKVLPSDVSSSPEQRQRFEREAKTISQLSHPSATLLPHRALPRAHDREKTPYRRGFRDLTTLAG